MKNLIALSGVLNSHCNEFNEFIFRNLERKKKTLRTVSTVGGYEGISEMPTSNLEIRWIN